MRISKVRGPTCPVIFSDKICAANEYESGFVIAVIYYTPYLMATGKSSKLADADMTHFLIIK